MQIGIDGFVAAVTDPATGLPLSPVERMRNLLEEIKVADRVEVSAPRGKTVLVRRASIVPGTRHAYPIRERQAQPNLCGLEKETVHADRTDVLLGWVVPAPGDDDRG